MPEPLITLPEFDTGSYIGCTLCMANGAARLEIKIAEKPAFVISFQKVRWHQFTALYNCTVDMIEGFYFCVAEVNGSSAVQSYIQNDRAPRKAYSTLHHYRIFLDETGCHEFFAESVSHQAGCLDNAVQKS